MWHWWSALGFGTRRIGKTKMFLPNITNDWNGPLPTLAIQPQSHKWMCQQLLISVDVLASDVGNMQKKIFKMNAAVIKRIEGIGGTCTVYAEIIFSFMIVCYMHFSVHDQWITSMHSLTCRQSLRQLQRLRSMSFREGRPATGWRRFKNKIT